MEGEGGREGIRRDGSKEFESFRECEIGTLNGIERKGIIFVAFDTAAFGVCVLFIFLVLVTVVVVACIAFIVAMLFVLS